MNPKNKPKLVVVGDITVDVLVQVERIPKIGQDAIVRQLNLLPGGSAANCAAVAARLGAQVSFVGVIGRDIFAPMLRDDLAQCGVDLQHLRELDGSTAVVIAMVDPAGERTFLSYRGAAATQDYGPVPQEILRPGDTLHVSGYALQPGASRKLALELISIAREVGARISLDPSFHFAQHIVSDAGRYFKELDVLFPNREEALLITNSGNIHQAARRLIELGVKTVLLKLGGEGCLVAEGDDLSMVPAYELDRVVDSTGAGDGFAGGYLAAASAGCRIMEAVAIGQAVAAITIVRMGGHAGAPHLDELRDFASQREDQRLLAAVNTMEAGLVPG